MWSSLTKQGEPWGGRWVPAAQMPQVLWFHSLSFSVSAHTLPFLPCPAFTCLSTVLNIRLHGGEEKGELS